MNIIKYKDYAASIEFSDEDDCLVGRILGIRDIVSFHADTVQEIRKVFEESVEDYIDMCQKIRKEPQKPYSGTIYIRTTPEIHAKVAKEADAHGKSLNSYVEELLIEKHRSL